MRKNSGMNIDRHRAFDRAVPLQRVTVLAMCSLVMSSCAVVETTASVAKTTASVVATTVETTASVAKTTTDIGLKTASTAATIGGVAMSAGSATMSAGSAAVSAGAAARTATAATAGVAVAGATAVAGAVKWGIEFSRDNDLEYANITTAGGDRFSSREGARIITQDCSDARSGEPALLVTRRNGDFYVRTNGRECQVLFINEANSK